MGTQSFYITNHPVERAAGTNAFLLRQFLIWHYILAIQLLPRADDVDVVERQPYPVLVVLCKVIGSVYAEGL